MRRRSRSVVSRPPPIEEEGTSPLAVLDSLRSSTPYLPLPTESEAAARIETRKYGELLQPLQGTLDEAQKNVARAKADATAWEAKYKAACHARDDLQSQLDKAWETADKAVAEATAWKTKYKAACADLQAQLDIETQKNWALQYKLQDAQEDSRVLLGYLKNSIHARFQGAPGDSDDDGWDNAEDGSRLPVEAYESRRARLLGRRLRQRQQTQQEESGLGATGNDGSQEKVPVAYRTGSVTAKAVEEKPKVPAQGPWGTGEGGRDAPPRKASGKDWERGKPRR